MEAFGSCNVAQRSTARDSDVHVATSSGERVERRGTGRSGQTWSTMQNNMRTTYICHTASHLVPSPALNIHLQPSLACHATVRCWSNATAQLRVSRSSLSSSVLVLTSEPHLDEIRHTVDILTRFERALVQLLLHLLTLFTVGSQTKDTDLRGEETWTWTWTWARNSITTQACHAVRSLSTCTCCVLAIPAVPTSALPRPAPLLSLLLYLFQSFIFI